MVGVAVGCASGCGTESSGTLLDNTVCSVRAQDDDSSFSSLRRKLEEGFNRRVYRFCTETIRFYAEDGKDFQYDIALKKPILIDNPFDQDFDGDGHGLVIDTVGATVALDATRLPLDSCAIEIFADQVKIGAMTIFAKANVWPICDFGEANDLSEVVVQFP